MLDIKYISPEIEEASTPDNRLYLTANIAKPVTLFQAQSMKVSTGVAIKSDQLVFAVPTIENNHMGLIPGSGVELLDTSEGGEIELFLWNRNVPGQQRSIEIVPGMRIAELVVMPRYNLEKKPEAPAKTDKGAGTTGAAKSPGRPKKPAKDSEAA